VCKRRLSDIILTLAIDLDRSRENYLIASLIEAKLSTNILARGVLVGQAAANQAEQADTQVCTA
jgi:hypothetical protein